LIVKSAVENIFQMQDSLTVTNRTLISLTVNHLMLRKKIRLRTLLTTLSCGAVTLTAITLIGALALFQRANIVESLLQNNIAYARKLADTTDSYLTIAQSELQWSANLIKGLDNIQLLRDETERLRLQSHFFNSVVIVNSDRIVAATSPESLQLVGQKLSSGTSLLAISTKKPFISKPFTSASGNYVVFISHPLFSDSGHYLGYIGGTIYLKKQSMLSDILSQHFYPTGSDIRIVNDDGMIIFSHNPSLVGTSMNLAPSAREYMSNNASGKLTLDNKGEQDQEGYASLTKTDWNIFITGSDRTVNEILQQTARKAVWFILIIIVFLGTLMMFLGIRVASPLERLADIVRKGGSTDDKSHPLESIQPWYYEADQLKDAVQEHIRTTAAHVAELTDDAITDPLTGIYNRRGFKQLSENLLTEKALCIICIDIDHFKKINDGFGHDAGDVVLIMLATILREACRKDDTVSRFGGEEFILLMPGTSLNDASATAERIRHKINSTHFPSVGHITISAGVAALADCGGDMKSLLHRADEALYEAKGAGRNVVITADKSGFRRLEKS
jgi:diguanylate cyclase (GGDEF)-like protein